MRVGLRDGPGYNSRKPQPMPADRVATREAEKRKPESTDEGHGAVQGNRGRSWRVVGGRDISQRVLHDLKVASNVGRK